MSDPLIRLEGVTKVFLADDVETHALADINLTIGPNEFVAIAGPSGCGKSTLLAIIGLLERPSRGEYHLGGRPTGGLARNERARIRNEQIGFIFQSFHLIGDLSVAQNVELPLIYRGLPAAARRSAVADALARVGMTHRARHRPAQLSGGQQQRAAVARALVGRPTLLLADEPTGNLDSRNGEEVMALLGELHRQGTAVVMVTHDHRFARAAARTVSLFDGALAAPAGAS